MTKNDFYNWVVELKEKTPIFVSQMENINIPGKYRLTLSGDLINEKVHWGLAQTTFATRILYIFNKLNDYQSENNFKYIKTFQEENGAIYDHAIKIRSFPRRVYATLRGANISEFFFYNAIERAETRQAIAALLNLNKIPDKIYKKIPQTSNAVKKYLKNLNWNFGAGSNINHLLFFTYVNSKLSNDEKAKIVDLVENYIKDYHQENGLFYNSGVSNDIHQRITFTMKIIMGLTIFNRQNKWINENLFNTLTESLNPIHACQNFNPILLLSEISTSKKEKLSLVQNKVLEYAERWKNDFYFPEHGGFSFNKNKSSISYYGAKISKGYNEPDLHGTAMFVWGVLLVAKILGIKDELGLKIPIL